MSARIGLLPERFLRWNYFPRGKALRAMAENSAIENMNGFLLDSVRHNPALCTALREDDGSIFLNAKIVGMGYIVKQKLLKTITESFELHVKQGDELFTEARNEKERQQALEKFQRSGAELLLEHLYFEKLEEAEMHVDFGKMATIELALSKLNSSKHTWRIVQHSPNAVLLFYQPPMISYELRGTLEIHEDDEYHRFVNLVHDSFHYVPAERRDSGRRPVYIFNIAEVYDNSASKDGFGTLVT